VTALKFFRKRPSLFPKFEGLKAQRIRALLFLVFTLLFINLGAQPVLRNAGQIRIHPEGKLGFHIGLINDTPFDENYGLCGFYGRTTIVISGAIMPVFYDIELFNPDGVILETSLGINHNANFITGDILTQGSKKHTFLYFRDKSFHSGSSDPSKVDGLVAVSGQTDFTFPVGDSRQLRPLTLLSEQPNSFAKCAYYFSDLSNITASHPELNARKAPALSAVSSSEFWELHGSIPSRIAVEWNLRSGLEELTTDLDKITLVGWSKEEKCWVVLEKEAQSGTIQEGSIISAPFVPDKYQAISFGSLGFSDMAKRTVNFLLTPNGDGVNDFLRFPDMEASQDNHLSIYDRNGLKVFDRINYIDEFVGEANVSHWIIAPGHALPEGLYFYLLLLPLLHTSYQGFLYLER